MVDKDPKVLLTKEQRDKIEKARTLIELGVEGVSGQKILEELDKGERIARDALTCLLRARFSLQVLKLGTRTPEDKKEREKHIEALMAAETFFEQKFMETFGRDFEPVEELLTPKK